MCKAQSQVTWLHKKEFLRKYEQDRMLQSLTLLWKLLGLKVVWMVKTSSIISAKWEKCSFKFLYSNTDLYFKTFLLWNK